MSETPFIITIDTEGDDLWANPREITTRNSQYLPRFQSLCERFRFKPVYLANYEMAMSDVFVEFARDVIARGAGEIGMHLHAWNSPPLVPLTSDDFRFHPYLIEYPEVQVKVAENSFKARARVIPSETDLSRRVQQLSRDKYGWGDGLIVELTPENQEPKTEN